MNCEKLTNTKNEYDDFCNDTQDLGNYSEITTSAFHYTTEEALKNILNEKVLRLTDIFTQESDPYEIKAGMEVCGSLLSEIRRTYPSNRTLDCFVESFGSVLMDSANIEKTAHYFLFCASSNGENEYLWKNYAEEGKGFCIEFSQNFVARFRAVQGFDDGTTSNGSSSTFTVNYSQDNLCEILRGFITRCLNKLYAGAKKASCHEEELFIKCMCVQLAVRCITHCIEYKQSKFEFEEEIRFLRTIDVNRKPKNVICENSKKFVELELKCDDIKSIRSGPRSSKCSQEKLEKILGGSIFQGICIKKSSISNFVC